MPGRTMRVNKNELKRVAQKLDSLGDRLRNLQKWQQNLAEDIPQEDVADALHDFEAKWRNVRADMVGQLRGLADGWAAIGEAFAETDLTVSVSFKSAANKAKGR